MLTTSLTSYLSASKKAKTAAEEMLLECCEMGLNIYCSHKKKSQSDKLTGRFSCIRK